MQAVEGWKGVEARVLGGEMNELNHQFQRFSRETLQPLTTIEPTAASTNALTLSD